MVPAKKIHGAGKILSKLSSSNLKEAWKRGREVLRDYFWDESRALLALIAVSVIVLGGLYLTGTLHRAYPYVLISAARCQEILQGPGDPENTYTLILGLRPSWGEVYYRRGLMREKRNQNEGALADLEMATTLMRSPTAPFLAHGRISTKLGRMDQALWDFKTALEKEPHSGSIFLERGRTLMKMERFSDALEDFKQASKDDPELVDAHIGIEEAQRAIEQTHLRKQLTGE